MRNKTIDGMKAIAIIVVVLYHMGILTYGFLGVDIFFVIGGYFAARSLIKNDSVIPFIGNRIKRLLPAILIAGIICLMVGNFGMLPDDYENVSEQIIASNVLSENILSAITTANYWDVVNDYKPLMHMWYVGVLFEFYLLFPLVYKGLKRFGHVSSGVAFLSLLSLALYLLPITSASNKFYFLPFRFFEFGVGCLICIYKLKKENKVVFYSSFAGILLLLLMNPISIDERIRLLAVVFLSGIMLVTTPEREGIVGNRFLSIIGMRSYSIFVWHQFLLAFYRYFFSNDISVVFTIIYFIIVIAVSELSYRMIEQKLGRVGSKKITVLCVILFVFSCGASGYIFLRAGVVRDIPELDVYMSDVHRGMHAEYCDRVYSYNRDFLNNGNPKVLVVGNSFARDWANILIESGIPLDLSYSYNITEELIPRIKEADYIFYRVLYEKIPEYGFETTAKIYGISTKNFGESNGIIYKNRYSDGYFEQTIRINEAIMQEYRDQKKLWGIDCYVDMIEPVEISEGVVRVFTDDHKFISQDCRHLTRAGAIYYSNLFDFDKVFSKE